MQTFSQTSEKRTMTMPALTAQSLEYGRDELSFLAFGGTDKPRTTTQEYQTASNGSFYYDNTYGSLGKGEYKAKYGLVWDGEKQIYDPTNQQARRQMKDMTIAASKEKMQGNSGAVIHKEGRLQCTPGYVLQNGICVIEPATPICQPGWRKVDGVCVKAPREFEHGEKDGSFGTTEASIDYPVTKDNVLSLKRLRQYIQERQTVDDTYSLSSGLAPLAVVFFMFVAIAVGANIATRRN